MTEEVHNDGAFAGYIVTDERSLLRLPEGSHPRAGALAEPLAVALHGITRGHIGDGRLRHGVRSGADRRALDRRARDPRARSGVRRRAGRRRASELARQLGADEVLDPSDLEVFPAWEPDRISTRAVDVVLECSGKKAAMEAGFNQLRRGGRLVMVGAGIEAPTFDPNRMLLNELTITGSFVYDADGFDRALELLADPRFPTEALIDPSDVPLDGLIDALHGLADGRIAAKAMVVPRRSTATQLTREISMTHPYYPTGNPRFNHVAMSVPADLLDEVNRTDICNFWGEVMGFDEMPTRPSTASASSSAACTGTSSSSSSRMTIRWPARGWTTSGSPSATSTSWRACATGPWPSATTTIGSTSSIWRSTTRSVIKIHSIYVELPAADDVRVPVVGVRHVSNPTGGSAVSSSACSYRRGGSSSTRAGRRPRRGRGRSSWRG